MGEAVILKRQLMLRGLPPQGDGFFKMFYTAFRGSGITLYGAPDQLHSIVSRFMTATAVLVFGKQFNRSSLSLAPSITSIETYHRPDKEGSQLPEPDVDQNAAVREIRLSALRLDSSEIPFERDRDLVFFELDQPYIPSPDSSDRLTDIVVNISILSERLIFGGFLVLVMPVTSSGTDLLLSAICFMTNSSRAMMYSGAIAYNDGSRELTILWLFRVEPMNIASVDTQRAKASVRLRRYPPTLQEVVRKTTRSKSSVEDVDRGIRDIYGDVLLRKVTPNTTLGALFRTAESFRPREVFSQVGAFQPHYSGVIDRARMLPDLKIQLRIIYDMLYDFGLAIARLGSPTSVPCVDGLASSVHVE